MRATTRILILALALPAAAVPASGGTVFPHDTHLQEGLDCATCHEAVIASTSPLAAPWPDRDLCLDCHDEDDVFLDAVLSAPSPTRPGRNFSHAAHADLDCATCHGDVAAAAPHFPRKDICRSCHATADDYADCRFCHAEGESLLPADHGTDWSHFHGVHARMDQDRCYLCHTETSCQDCHAGDNVRPRSHGLDFSYGHSIQARAHEADCMTCHLETRFCNDCHAAERVLPRSHSRVDWVLPSGGRHAEDGLFDLESCIACHDAGAEAPDCARCHGGG